ncbi:phage portal protein [Duganella sp. FT94W]|uniref:Phage portal protein n=1 Tax=Duganella lactea TaxID=2692173 RepID=A0ABW9VF83_9BURK|nr:phage portal protein [Duganella lactea]MYM37253.1 phage portal protein [Duganella lactea]
MSTLKTFGRWIGSRLRGLGGATAEKPGAQVQTPGQNLVPNSSNIGTDGALQISAVWACIDRRATTIASLPLFAYDIKDGDEILAPTSRLYQLMHDSPNSRMTPFEFWRAMMMFYDLRGRAYARIDRDANGEAIALWPMPADQVESKVLPDGSMTYIYRFGNDVVVLAEANVLHLKNLGNGTEGLSKLEFMRASTDEAAKAQAAASELFASGGKPTGVLMVDKLLSSEQRAAVKRNFAEMTEGTTARLHVLEANMKYEPLQLTPEQLQLLATRNYSVEEICRWFDVPPVLVHHANVTAWGTGIEQIVQGFYTTAIRPMVVNLEQALRKRVMSPRQRATMKVEFDMDALLRASPVQRAEINAKNVQNGLNSRAEIRRADGWRFVPGTEVFTVQSNLIPIHMLGKVPPARGGSGNDIAQ